METLPITPEALNMNNPVQACTVRGRETAHHLSELRRSSTSYLARSNPYGVLFGATVSPYPELHSPKANLHGVIHIARLRRALKRKNNSVIQLIEIHN
jgi:hypothetical protein